MATMSQPHVSDDSSARCDAFARDERIVLLGLLMEAHGRLTRQLNADLEASSSLPLTWYDVMVRLRRSPEQRLTMGELANQIVLTTGGVTRLIDRLEEAGLVERVSCPTDRRTTYLTLTELGDARLEEATVAHLDHLDHRLVSRLSPAERQVLRETLERLCEGSCG